MIFLIRFELSERLYLFLEFFDGQIMIVLSRFPVHNLGKSRAAKYQAGFSFIFKHAQRNLRVGQNF